MLAVSPGCSPCPRAGGARALAVPARPRRLPAPLSVDSDPPASFPADRRDHQDELPNAARWRPESHVERDEPQRPAGKPSAATTLTASATQDPSSIDRAPGPPRGRKHHYGLQEPAMKHVLTLATVARVSVEETCATYLELADRHAPGLVQGLYLQGSIALGDYRPGTSDIDFVAVVSGPPDLRALEVIHAGLRRVHGRTCFDGLYVEPGDLRRPPSARPLGPAVHEWRVQPSSAFERNLVTWHVLAQSGVAVRGPAVGELGVHTDWPALAVATRDNLAGYWTRWRDVAARGPVGFSAQGTCWGVLGAARVRHTLAAGRVTSKTEAARYALETYDERWHRIVREALRIRVGGPALYRTPFRRRADLIDFLGVVLR
ncbi:aminoglycoside adenylyltransferase domain-containing protein [Actinoplanes sp. NPDC049599]|uniref:nucleotidyltransferase domain-containing protein n=1 Tax=Actinoplanes sp. NPDC049599 TaxID=3363903 RepID=UPI0037A3893E